MLQYNDSKRIGVYSAYDHKYFSLPELNDIDIQKTVEKFKNLKKRKTVKRKPFAKTIFDIKLKSVIGTVLKVPSRRGNEFN